MMLKLTRRRFGQIALTSAAAAGLGYLANKTVAQTPNLLIYGARPVTQAGKIVVQTLNVTANVIQDVTSVPIESGEKLTGFTFLANRTIVLSISTVLGGKKKKENATRLVFVGTAPKTLTVSGLKKEDTLESLLGLKDGSLIGLVIKKNGRPPVNVVSIDTNNGRINVIDKIKLPQTERFSNLAQCPNGKIYTTAVGRLGDTRLVQLDLGQGKVIPLSQLKFDNKVWNNGLNSLICSPGSQLLAFGAPRYESPNKVYIVNPTNGVMTLLVKGFNVAEIAIPQS
jgi:hypothetical protein